MNSHDVQEARRKEQVREIVRKGRIAKWRDYTSFIVSFILGVGGLTIGGTELLVPDFLPLVLPEPAWVTATGLALLTGKDIIKLIGDVGRRKE